LAAHGKRLAVARVQLEEQDPDPSALLSRPTVVQRYLSQQAATRQNEPLLGDIVMTLTDDLSAVDIWAGTAELKIPKVQHEATHLLAPVRVGRGYRLGMARTAIALQAQQSYAS
jgi:acetoacetate decarboxylase